MKMLDLLDDLDAWRSAGLRCALARVVDTEGSGPRDPGAAMAVSESGDVIGSVSGGCVESAVVTEALDVLGNNSPRLVSFGYSDDDAFAVGLTCGGTVHIFIEPFERSAPLVQLEGRVRTLLPVVLSTVISGPGVGSKLIAGADDVSAGTLGNTELDRVVLRDSLGELNAGTTTVRHYGPSGEAGGDEVTVFIESFAPPPRMIIFGAVDFTAALCRVGKNLGFHVTVCDAREVFATPKRLPLADTIVVDWPHRLLQRTEPPLGPRDAICVLTHDNKFDVPAIVEAFSSDVGYIGALGSRRTAEHRRNELVAAGATAEQLARLHAPIGLDLGGRTPEETAVSIGAEIIANRNGRSAASLTSRDGPIHS